MEKLKNLLKTDTLKKSSITFSSTLVNGALGVAFFIVTARFLGPVSFGLLMVAITTCTLVSDISDLGVGSGMVRFVSKYASKNRNKAYQYMKLGMVTKLIVGTTVVIIGYLISPLISMYIFDKPDLIFPLRIAFLGVLGVMLFNFGIHTLQSFQKFAIWGSLYIATNTLRLLLVILLVLLSKLNLSNVLSIYIMMPFLGFLISLFIIPKQFVKSEVTLKTRKQFFNYNKWIALMTAVAAFSSRVDIFISAKFLSLDQVGIYTASSQLVQVIPQLASSIGAVLAPKMSAKENLEDLIDYLKKTQLMVTGLVALAALAMPLAFIFIPLFYGANYLSSVPIFLILFTSMLIFLFSVPVHNAIFYYFSNPKLFFYLAIIQLVVVTLGSILLINTFGVSGLALSVLVGSSLNFLIPTLWLFNKIHKS